MSVTWEELVKNRVPLGTRRHSAQMMRARKKVLDKMPNAKIAEAGKDLWQLLDGGTAISNKHNSHYECWLEASTLMDQVVA
jgi:hypothetical protein